MADIRLLRLVFVLAYWPISCGLSIADFMIGSSLPSRAFLLSWEETMTVIVLSLSAKYFSLSSLSFIFPVSSSLEKATNSSGVRILTCVVSLNLSVMTTDTHTSSFSFFSSLWFSLIVSPVSVTLTAYLDSSFSWLADSFFAASASILSLSCMF